MDVAKFAGTLRQIVLARIEQDKLTLPAMPEVAARCTDLLKAAEPDLPALAREVERDPLVAAEVLRLANSAALGGAVQIKALPQAVSRIGVGGMKTLMVQIAARKLCKSSDARIAVAFRGLWEHSLAVAVIAQALGNELQDVDADVAYQAGLMHDLGKPIVGVMMLEAEKMSSSSKRPPKNWMTSDEWLQVVDQMHRRVGVALAEKWDMPDDVCRAVESEEYDGDDYGSVPNLVRYANNLAKRMGMYPSKCSLSELEPLLKEGRKLSGIDPDALEMLLDGMPAEVQQRVA